MNFERLRNNFILTLIISVGIFMISDAILGKEQVKLVRVTNTDRVAGYSELDTFRDSKGKTHITTHYVPAKYYVFIDDNEQYREIGTTLDIYGYSSEHKSLYYYYRKGKFTGVHYFEILKTK